MTPNQLIQFKFEFKGVVYLKGKLTEAGNRIALLTRLDNNCSHTKAIMKALESRDGYIHLSAFEYIRLKEPL